MANSMYYESLETKANKGTVKSCPAWVCQSKMTPICRQTMTDLPTIRWRLVRFNAGECFTVSY